MCVEFYYPHHLGKQVHLSKNILSENTHERLIGCYENL